MTGEIPEYLGRESAKERKMIARFRCGNKERENRYSYWTEDGRRKGYRMDERDMYKEGHNVKTKGWGLEREMLYRVSPKKKTSP
jgi:hypothetical protein